jgi:hypothetical protein
MLWCSIAFINAVSSQVPGGCGPSSANTKCPSTLCCSQYGYCGSTSEYCGNGCQGTFGVCGAVTPSVSPDGSCGGTSKYNCLVGQCCSQYGWCGTGAEYCGIGCQSLFSTGCTTSPVPSTHPPVTGNSAIVYEKCVGSSKWVALTFDDGPSSQVPSILTKLAQYGVKATFYVNGNNRADANFVSNTVSKNNLQSIYNSGHQVFFN